MRFYNILKTVKSLLLLKKLTKNPVLLFGNGWVFERGNKAFFGRNMYRIFQCKKQMPSNLVDSSNKIFHRTCNKGIWWVKLINISYMWVQKNYLKSTRSFQYPWETNYFKLVECLRFWIITYNQLWKVGLYPYILHEAAMIALKVEFDSRLVKYILKES